MNLLYASLLAICIVIIQCFIGGTRLVFSLPIYAGIGLVSLLTLRSLRSPSARPNLPCLVWTVVFFAYMLVRAAWSPVEYLWWQDFYQMIGCLMVYGIFSLYAAQPAPRMLFLGVLFMLAVAEFFMGLRQFTVGDNWMPFGFIRGDSGVRASGSLISSIHFAGFLEVIGAFALAVACWSRAPGWVRFLVGYVALLCYAGVAISGSRGAWLSSAAAVVVFAALSLIVVRATRPQNLGKVVSWGIIVTVVVLAGGISLMLRNPLLQKRLSLVADQDLKFMTYLMADGTSGKTAAPGVDVRVYNWQAALDQARLAPLVGTGAGTHLFYGRLFRRPQIQADPIHAHSDYLEMVAEYGLVGLGGILVLVGLHLIHGWRRFRNVLASELADLDFYQPARSDNLALTIGALTAMATYLAHSVVDFNLHIPGNALTFAFVFAVLASPGAPLSEAVPSWERAFRLMLPAVAVWYACLGVPKIPGEYWCEKARIALRDRRLPLAVELANRAIASEKNNYELYFHLGESYRLLGLREAGPARKQHFSEAVRAYQESLRVFPRNEHVLVRLGQALEEAGQFVEAGACYREAISVDPNLGTLYAFYAQHLFRMGRYDDAHENYQKAARLGTYNLRAIIDPMFVDTPSEPHLPGE